MRPPEGYTWGSLAIEFAALLFAMAALIGAAAVGTLI
jgi:hypothetical protein